MRLSPSIIIAATVLFIGVVSVCANAYHLNLIGHTFGYSVVQASDGNYVITGSTDPYDKNQYCVYLREISAGGNTVWMKTYDLEDSDGRSVLQTSDGGYIIAGTTETAKSGEHVLLLKTDATGNEVWSRTYGRTGSDAGYYVAQTTDGGYIIVGKTNAYQNNTSYQDDIYLVRTDANGSIVWDRTYGDNRWDYGDSVAQTSDGGFIIGGLLHQACTDYADMCLIKTDPEGNITWGKAYGGDKNDFGNFAIQSRDGGYLIIGDTESFDSGHNGMFLVKADANGSMVWNKTYGGGGNVVAQTSDGGYILAGSRGVQGKDIGVYLVKTDANGNTIWNGTYGGNNSDSVADAIQTKDGGYITIGDSLDRNIDKIYTHVEKVDPHGNLVWDKTYSEKDFKINSSVPAQVSSGILVISHIIVLVILAVTVTVGYVLRKRRLI